LLFRNFKKIQNKSLWDKACTGTYLFKNKKGGNSLRFTSNEKGKHFEKRGIQPEGKETMNRCKKKKKGLSSSMFRYLRV
jgi:hypothetical protein